MTLPAVVGDTIGTVGRATSADPEFAILAPTATYENGQASPGNGQFGSPDQAGLTES